MYNFVVRIIFEVKMQGILWRTLLRTTLCFHIAVHCLLKIVPLYLLSFYTAISNPTLPRYRTKSESPPLWARRQHARLLRTGPEFDHRSGHVSWVRFFRGFSSPVQQMSGSFRPQGPRISFGSHHQSSFITAEYNLRCLETAIKCNMAHFAPSFFT